MFSIMLMANYHHKIMENYRLTIHFHIDDHSRVVLEPLDEDPHSDYINACFIKVRQYLDPLFSHI